MRDALAFEQWQLLERARYREVIVNGLRTLATQMAQEGDLLAAVDYNHRLLTLEPWREEAHRQLITWLALSGQRTAALAQYESCRRVLAEELAVEPDAETTALAEAIRIGALDPTAGRSVHAPSPPAPA